MIKTWEMNFWIIWIGQVFLQLSSSIIQFVIMWYLTDKSGSALLLSASMFISFLPQAVLGSFIGVYIDRYNRKMIMIISEAFIAFVSSILVVIDLFDKLSIMLILIVLLLRSIGTAFHQPTLQTIIPQIVPAKKLTKCTGYSQGLEAVSMLISPAIAAVLYSICSLSSIIFVDVIGVLIAILTLYISLIPSNSKQVEYASKFVIIKEAKEGFLLLKSNKGIMGLILIGTLYTLALMPTSAFFPLMSMSYFGGTSIHASIAEITFSVGLLFGSIVLGFWGGTTNKVNTIICSYLLMSLSLIFTGFLTPNDFYGFVFLSCLMGISGPFYWGMYNPILQQSVEKKYLGRMMSLSSSIKLIIAPVGFILSGIIADIFGVEKWFLIAGIITLIAAILCFTIPSIRYCEKSLTLFEKCIEAKGG